MHLHCGCCTTLSGREWMRALPACRNMFLMLRFDSWIGWGQASLSCRDPALARLFCHVLRPERPFTGVSVLSGPEIAKKSQKSLPRASWPGVSKKSRKESKCFKTGDSVSNHGKSTDDSLSDEPKRNMPLIIEPKAMTLTS